MEAYNVLGLMSGTSMDGLDIAYCTFEFKEKWTFEVKKTSTVPYSQTWQLSLQNAFLKSEEEIKQLDESFGIFLGVQCIHFINKNKITPNLIASHGHTVFHQPDKGITLQIGSGKIISKMTNIPTVYDFRSLDVKLGGQGAPLVPIGDKLLFGEYDFCLNLGGFSNISFEKNGKRVAFDICPQNIILNEISQSIGDTYDKNGELGRQGNINQELLTELNELDYYQKLPPKSLGKEFTTEFTHPILRKYLISANDKLRTYYEHSAIQISNVINQQRGKSVLVSGGGAHNSFFIEVLKSKTTKEIVIPSYEIIDFKEAIIFAFLGVLKHRNEINCLASVTGASRNSSGGVLVTP